MLNSSVSVEFYITSVILLKIPEFPMFWIIKWWINGILLTLDIHNQDICTSCFLRGTSFVGAAVSAPGTKIKEMLKMNRGQAVLSTKIKMGSGLLSPPE